MMKHLHDERTQQPSHTQSERTHVREATGIVQRHAEYIIFGLLSCFEKVKVSLRDNLSVSASVNPPPPSIFKCPNKSS
jgi:hypothetical protein